MFATDDWPGKTQKIPAFKAAQAITRGSVEDPGTGKDLESYNVGPPNDSVQLPCKWLNYGFMVDMTDIYIYTYSLWMLIPLDS